uniref:Transposase n=1 Tax=Candidatus Nitrotoga fabula TaxID=2182327 RepID=A0A2X0RGT3_9PROT|nr:protein of unknown function [Candidatus Nitrotoga fabula]
MRCQKQHKKRYGKNDHRGIIPNRQFIEQRPAIVETRSRIGDWEADTIIGKNHQQAIVSLVERRTGFALIDNVERKTAQAVTDAMTKPLNHTAHASTRLLPTMGRNTPDTRSPVKTQGRVLLCPSLCVMGAWHQ